LKTLHCIRCKRTKGVIVALQPVAEKTFTGTTSSGRQVTVTVKSYRHDCGFEAQETTW
jgi:cobalamin-dependent methionine synthase I